MKKIVALTIVVFALTGCKENTPDISIEKFGNKIYLLDQKQSQAFIVQNESLIPLKRNHIASLKVGQTLVSQSTISSGRLSVETKVKWLGTKVLYSMYVTPTVVQKKAGEDITVDKSNLEWFSKEVKNRGSNNFIRIELNDKDDFKLDQHSIVVSRDFVRAVNDKGEVEAYSYEGSFQVDPEITQYTSNVNLVWSL